MCILGMPNIRTCGLHELHTSTPNQQDALARLVCVSTGTGAGTGAGNRYRCRYYRHRHRYRSRYRCGCMVAAWRVCPSKLEPQWAADYRCPLQETVLAAGVTLR